MIGSRITTRIAKARWTWSEMTSPRFADKYPSLGTDAVRLQTLARNGTAFSVLPEPDVGILERLIEIRQQGFMPALDGVSEFACLAWTKSELMNSITIIAMSPGKNLNIPYGEFFTNPPHIVDGIEEWSDPRVAAKSWPKGKPYLPMEPAIAICVGDKKMLIDGYGRSVIFMHHGKDTDRLLVWVPAHCSKR